MTSAARAGIILQLNAAAVIDAAPMRNHGEIAGIAILLPEQSEVLV
jgi:hypothetical protein